MEKKFTPGEWIIDPKVVNRGYHVRYDKGDGSGYSIAFVYPQGTRGNVALANAHLISASPKMYDYIKKHYLIPDCGADFCFLATEGMENECPEPEEGAGNCPHKEQCRLMNAQMIERDRILAHAEGKE